MIESVSASPISPLGQRLIEDMELRISRSRQSAIISATLHASRPGLDVLPTRRLRKTCAVFRSSSAKGACRLPP